MLKHVALGVACLLLLAPVAASDEAAPPTLEVRNFELLPLNKLERGELARDHPELVQRVTILAGRVTKLRGHLRGRKDPNDDGGRRIAAQIKQVEAELAPLIAQTVDASRSAGIDDRLLAHVAAAPGGPHRVARYAMGLVLYVEGLPDEPRKLFERLLQRVDGALIALAAQKQRLEVVAQRSKLGQAEREALASAHAQQVHEIEKRWWRLVDYVVPQAQRAAIHRVLPTAYQQPESIIQHIYGLPGITPAQGARIGALLKEIESEASPDSAAVKRLQREAADPKTPGLRKAAIQEEAKAATHRLLELQRWAVSQSKRILDAKQWEALEAIPPRVSFQDRQATSVDLLEGVDLLPAQRSRLDAMREELSDYRKAYQERRLKTAARAALLGPDSPELPGMQMEMAGIQAAGNVVQRRFNGRVLRELLTPEQVEAWVLAPPAQR